MTLGPNRSHAGPAVKRTRRLRHRQPCQNGNSKTDSRCNEGNNVRVGDVSGREVEIFRDGDGQLWKISELLVLVNRRIVLERYLQVVERRTCDLRLSFCAKDGVHIHGARGAYQDQKARKKPNHAKLKTRPYTLMTFNAGMERAFRLTGFTSGVRQRVVTSNMMRGRRWWYGHTLCDAGIYVWDQRWEGRSQAPQQRRMGCLFRSRACQAPFL